MANIKLKDLLKEMRIAGGVVSNNPWLKEEDDTPQINIKELVSSIENYNSLGEGIYGKGNLKEVADYKLPVKIGKTLEGEDVYQMKPFLTIHHEPQDLRRPRLGGRRKKRRTVKKKRK